MSTTTAWLRCNAREKNHHHAMSNKSLHRMRGTNMPPPPTVGGISSSPKSARRAKPSPRTKKESKDERNGALYSDETYESNDWEKQRLLAMIRSADDDPQAGQAASRAATMVEEKVAADMAAIRERAAKKK